MCRTSLCLLFLCGGLSALLEGQTAGVLPWTAGIGACGFLCLFSENKAGPGLWAGLSIVLLALVLAKRQELLQSAAAYGNVVLERLTVRRSRIYLPFSGAAAAPLFPAVLSAVFGALCALGQKKRGCILCALAVVLSIGTGLGWLPGCWIIPCGLALLGLWVTDDGRAWHRLIPACLVCGLALTMLLPFTQRFSEAGNRIGALGESAVHRLVHEDGRTGLPEGELQNLSAWEKSDAPVLEVAMDQPGKLYLRGYTGELYNGTRWTVLPDEALKEGSALFYWLHNSGFYGQNQLGTAVGSEPVGSLAVKNVGACNAYTYIPYGMMGDAFLDARAFPDGSVNGSRDYQAQMGQTGLTAWYSAQIELALHGTEGEYPQLESAYRAFVYEHYLELPESTAAALGQLLAEQGGTLTLPEIEERIHTFLAEKMTYNERAATDAGEADFVSYVLMGQGSGYSVHYATIAACLLRYYGVPSRYAEGYCLSADEAAMMQSGKPFMLDGTHEHAWAELYLNGVGWIPFEVTPGYLDDENIELQNLLEDPNSALHQALDQPYTQQQFDIPQAVLQQPDDPVVIKPDREYVLWPVLLLLLVVLAVGLAWMLLRNIRLRRRLSALEKGHPNEALPELFAYAMGLLEAFGGTDVLEEPQWQTGAQDNREALFSCHEITGLQLANAAELAREAERLCRVRSSVGKRLYLRWIRGIYR